MSAEKITTNQNNNEGLLKETSLRFLILGSNSKKVSYGNRKTKTGSCSPSLWARLKF